MVCGLYVHDVQSCCGLDVILPTQFAVVVYFLHGKLDEVGFWYTCSFWDDRLVRHAMHGMQQHQA